MRRTCVCYTDTGFAGTQAVICTLAIMSSICSPLSCSRLYYGGNITAVPLNETYASWFGATKQPTLETLTNLSSHNAEGVSGARLSFWLTGPFRGVHDCHSINPK